MRAFLYGCRVRGDGFTVGEQFRLLQEWANRNGLEVRGKFADRGNDCICCRRPGLRRLLRSIREAPGEADVVLVHSMKRLAGSLDVLIEVVDCLNAMGVSVVSTRRLDLPAVPTVLRVIEVWASDDRRRGGRGQ